MATKDKAPPVVNPDAFVAEQTGDLHKRLAAIEEYLAKTSTLELHARQAERFRVESRERQRERNAQDEARKQRRKETHAELARKGLDSATSLAPGLGGVQKLAKACGTTELEMESLLYVKKSIRTVTNMGDQWPHVEIGAVVNYLERKDGVK